MSTPVSTPRGGFGFENITVTLIFGNQKRHTMRTLDSINYGNNVKRAQGKGTQAQPVYNAGAAATPSCKIGGVARDELAEIRATQGPGYADDEVQVLIEYRRGKKPTINDEVQGWQCNDEPIDGKHGSPMTGGLEGDALLVLPDGLHPFNTNQGDQ